MHRGLKNYQFGLPNDIFLHCMHMNAFQNKEILFTKLFHLLLTCKYHTHFQKILPLV